MRANDKNPYYINIIIVALNNLFSISIAYLLLFTAFRILEFAALYYFHNSYPNLLRLELVSIPFDILFFFKLNSIVIIPYIILSFILNYRVINVLLMIAGSLLFCIYAGLILYFSSTLTPLGADFLGYSYEDIKQTVGSSGFANIFSLIPFIIIFLICFTLPIRFYRMDWNKYLVLIYFGIVILYSFSSINITPNNKNYISENNYNIVNNKINHLLVQLQKESSDSQMDLFDGFYFDDEFVENSTKYIDEKYPFLHDDSLSDVLSPFFADFTSKPNIVLIIVESMGRSYSGPNAELGSFTPFMDSLAEHGLYWENYLSNGGRTFAVLPSILGSLPFAKQGYLEQGKDMPNNLNLLNILKRNGYYTSFQHGGEAKFDNMNMFLEKSKVDEIIQRDNFNRKYSLMPANKQGFTWGYGDLEVFKNYIDRFKNQDKPRFDVFLTLSNHNPFQVNNQKYYENLFIKKIDEFEVTGEGRVNYLNYKKMYTCIMYSDDAIRQFMNAYKKSPKYKNTIFIITGDHRMPEIPITKSIDRFHVPLIIYSPLLKRTGSFKGVCSQLDLAPSFLALLKTKSGVVFPNEKSWIGNGLDTSATYTAAKFIPLMRNKDEFIDYIDNNIYVAKNISYKIFDNFECIENNDATLERLAKTKYNQYKSRNTKATTGNFILPDSVYQFKVR